MRILVGTLYTIENELEECLAAIKSQTHPDFESFVLQDLPKETACATLYRNFMDRADQFDLSRLLQVQFH